jgi:hypothetical protein
MRHILTPLIAFHWMAVFALLGAVSTLGPEHGILAALSLLGAAPTPDAILSGGGPLAAGFFSFAFAVAGVLFLWTLATAFFSGSSVLGDAEDVARLAFGTAVGSFSLLMLTAAAARSPALIVASCIAAAALLGSFTAMFAERWAVTILSAPSDSDLRAAARVMTAGAAHTVPLGQISCRSTPAAATVRSL